MDRITNQSDALFGEISMCLHPTAAILRRWGCLGGSELGAIEHQTIRNAPPPQERNFGH